MSGESAYPIQWVEMYVGKLCGEPAGKMALFSSQGTAQIDEVYTMPKFRGQGILSTLLAALICIAKQRRFDNIVIVAPEKSESYQIYKKIGFIEKVKLAGYYR